MRVPLEWLAEYVDLDVPVDELANKLTLVGLKVESIERLGGDWQDVLVGEVVETRPHPGSKKPMTVAKVSVGDDVITVVSAAPNVRTGAKVAVVLVGGLLPHGPDGAPMVIQPRNMAGIVSEGMLASERELGISDEHEGILILPPDAPLGAHLRTVLGDDVLDIETNPNRPDTLSIIGIAREVATVTQQQVMLPDTDQIDGSVEWLPEESIRVEVEDLELCPRYSALRIEGVKDQESPSWMKIRLEAAGMRSISLLVDITNYVMLEMGQPTHAFDATRLRGGRIVVRRAHDGEHLRTLDGVDRSLTSQNLVIADAERAVAIAGVMGGEDSEISAATNTIVLESANFNGISVRRTAQALGLRTESSSRFEKTLPPEQTVPAAMRYLQLLAEITGRPLRAARLSDVWAGPDPPKTVAMPLRDLDRLLGITVPATTAAETLSLLGFDVTLQDDAIEAEVPFWRRVDIERSADLVEEVARVIGYDAIPPRMPHRTMKPAAALPGLYWEGVVRQTLRSIGVNEAETHSLTSPENMGRLLAADPDGHSHDSPELWEKLVPNPAGVYDRDALTLPVRLLNPATQDRQVLRLTLVPSLLDVVARNLKHTDERLAFFEVDHTFFQRAEELPYERRTLALALSGKREPASWQNPAPPAFSFYDVKGMLAATLDALQVKDWKVKAVRHPALHPGRSAVIQLRGCDVAYFGELHPTVAQTFEIEAWPVQVAEVDLDAVFAAASDVRIFHPLPRFPSAFRDIAVVVREEIPAGDVLRIIHQAGGDLLAAARIFDVYAGDPLPAGTKSIAVAMEFRAPGATLTQEEVSEVMDRIVRDLAGELNASLRD